MVPESTLLDTKTGGGCVKKDDRMDIKKTAVGMVASARDTMAEIPGLSAGYSYLSGFGGRAAETIASNFRPSAISAAGTTAIKNTEAAYDMGNVADATDNDRTMDIKKPAVGMVTSAIYTMAEMPGLSTGYSYLSGFGGRAAETIASGFRSSAISAADAAPIKDTKAAYDMDNISDAESSEQTWNLKINGTTVALATGAGIAVVATPLIISGMGFTAAGVAANSYGAYMMSLYGGAVPAGGLVATLQSAGVLGVSATTTCGTAVVGAGTGYGIKKVVDRKKD